MNCLEEKLSETLLELKNNYNMMAIKAEFGEEGSSVEEIFYLKDLLNTFNIDLTVKIGGCEALNDMRITSTIGACSIVAPMVESAYALKKFIKLMKIAYSDCAFEALKLFVNIETITGYTNLDEILSSEEAKKLNGIVFGRSDMAYSLGWNCSYVNSDKLLKIASNLSQKTIDYKKDLIIGGAISKASIKFLKTISLQNLSGFETRKVIFDAALLENSNLESGLRKALEFELLWLKNKEILNKHLSDVDKHRLQILESRYNELK